MARDTALLAGKDPCKAISYKEIRAMFYRYDTRTMLKKVTPLEQAFDAHKKVVKAAMDNGLQSPLHDVMKRDADAGDKANAIVVKYMMQHFKVACDC